MLVLTLYDRRKNSVTLTVPPSDTPTEIVVCCTKTSADKSRIGFEAPRDVVIVRSNAKLREPKDGKD